MIHRASPSRLAATAALALALAPTGCSVLDPSWTATGAGADGRPPVTVTAELDGNTGLGDTTLLRQIEDYLFDLSRDPSRETAAYDAALELEDFYRARGYPTARVAYHYAPPAPDAPWPAAVHVRFDIDDGPLVTVALRLTGNSVHSTDELLEFWARRRSGVLRLGDAVFVEARLHEFVEELRTFYRAEGRLDAVVVGPSIHLDLDARIAHVAVDVDEGHLHTIREVVVADAVDRALGDRRPLWPVGQPFAAATVREYRLAVRNALRAGGHPDPTVTTSSEPLAEAPYALRLRVDGDPGPRATVAAVQLSGNDKTLDGTILDRIDTQPGTPYDGVALDTAVQRLYRTGLFRKVDLREVPVDGDPTRVVLDVRVEEIDSRAVEVLGGYGSYEQLRGGVRLEERNLFGTGRGITLDNRVSMKGYATGITLSDPDFLATESILTVTGEYFQRQEPSFTDEAAGATIALARPVFGKVTARVGYTYRPRTDARAFTALPRDRLVDYVEGKVFVELRNDQRDSLLFPRRGHAEFLAFERIAPEIGASVDLDRLTLRATRHVTLFDPVNLVLRAEQNVLWPHEGSAQVPLQERWFNGGESTVRSFREAELGPEDADGRPVGGEFRHVFGVELRLPVSDTFETVLFVDAGNVGRDVQGLTLRGLSYAIGTGVRVLLPIGPVRLDAGWNPDRDPGDAEWVLHLSVGYPF